MVLLITFAAAGLRFHEIGRHALWVDELLSMETSSGYGFEAHWNVGADGVVRAPDLIGLESARPWWMIPAAMNRDVHPPLYFLLLRGWRELFGDSEAAARSLAAVFGVAGVPLLFLLGRELFGTVAGIWACTIYAVATPQVQLSQEVRGYVPLVTLTIATATTIIWIQRRGGSPLRYALLVLGAAAMLLTHYFAVGVLMGMGLYVLIRFERPLRWKTAGAMVAAGLVALAAWAPMMMRQLSTFSSVHDWVAEDPAGHTARTLQRVAVLPVTYLNEPMGTSLAIAAVGVVCYVLPWFLLRRRPALLLPVLMLSCTVGYVMALDLFRTASQLLYVRYTLAAAPAAYLLIAALPAGQRWLQHALPAAAVVSCLISLPRAYSYHTPPKPDWRWFTAEITRDGPVDTVVILGPRGHTWLTSHYLGLYYYLDPKPRYVVAIDEGMSDATRAHLRNSRSVWALTTSTEQRPPPAGFAAERAVGLGRGAGAMKLRPVD